jgi:hypothetical protein
MIKTVAARNCNSPFAERGCARSVSRSAWMKQTTLDVVPTCCGWSFRHSRAPGKNENRGVCCGIFFALPDCIVSALWHNRRRCFALVRSN